jgi:hypothetical protein
MAKLRDGNLWLQYNTQQLTETKTLSSMDKQYQFLGPEGANRSVLLPTVSGSGGLEYTIANTATSYNLIVKNDSNNIIFSTIEPGDVAKFICNNSVWKAMTNTIPSGDATGDFIRWNAENSTWEVAVEPLSLKQINLVPSSSATLDEEGGVWYNSVDKQLMLCISEE